MLKKEKGINILMKTDFLLLAIIDIAIAIAIDIAVIAVISVC